MVTPPVEDVVHFHLFHDKVFWKEVLLTYILPNLFNGNQVNLNKI